LAAPKANHKDDSDFEFDCPECGVHITGEVSRCPKCDVEFLIEEVSEFECPRCGAAVPADSVKCTACGADFKTEEDEVEPSDARNAIQAMEALNNEKVATDQKELNDQFSNLVIEVRPLLMLAKDFGVDTTSPRRLIDKAVRAGRARDVNGALSIMTECRELLLRIITDRVDRDVMYLETLTEVAKKMNSDPSSIQKVIEEAKSKRSSGDLEGALGEARSGKRMAEQLTGKYIEAHDMYEALESLVLNSEQFYLDVREARKLLNETREAGERGDWSTMGILARKGREELNRSLPEVLRSELRRAKQTLLEAKANGKDVTVLVKILKDAGVALKREKFEEALERITEFRAEEKNL
jgi:predicted RNA-binding Zn-ribbon protein involved in translation (DUF1610 family)